MTLGFTTGLRRRRDQIDSQNLGHHAPTEGQGTQSGCSILSSPLPIPGRTGRNLQRRNRTICPHARRWHLVEKRIGDSAPAPAVPSVYQPILTSITAIQRTSQSFSETESAWSFEGGPEWNPGGRISAQLTAFHRRDHNDIDYV